MSNSNIFNQSPYLRTSRDFTQEGKEFSREVQKSYIDAANAINARTIGIFSNNKPVITGEGWFFDGRKQQTLRQFYAFTTTSDINIGFKISSIDQFSRFFGQYRDASYNWYGLIPGTSVAIPGQISFYVAINGASTTSDVIKFVLGAGAPAIAQGLIVLEWLSEV